MAYTVKHIDEPRESFGSYRYAIYRDGEKVAVFWHNYRGECEGIKVLSTGFTEDPPFAMCHHFLTQGGPSPLELTDKAIRYLQRIL